MVQHQTTPALQVPQSGALSPVFSQTHTEPGMSAPATPSTPNLGAPSTPLILSLADFSVTCRSHNYRVCGWGTTACN